ncbi:hypothetical protein E3U43_002196 [Larimichthys crocea]|uniref:Uncharacterized protein n=1 Tax=Larimichthys crocea TaxID=215358 RepID=A0ACD3QQT7_LARCR|nr:hypothetical protein E3U43_002196 [Larimichthys crocea]
MSDKSELKAELGEEETTDRPNSRGEEEKRRGEEKEGRRLEARGRSKRLFWRP